MESSIVEKITLLESSSMDSSSVKPFPSKSNSTELSFVKLPYSELCDNAYERYFLSFITAYTEFCNTLESATLQLDRYRFTIKKFNKVIKQLTKSSYNIIYIIKSFNIEIQNIICKLKSDILKMENNISKICEYNINFKQFIAKYKTQIQKIRGIVPDITIESSKTDNESKDNQDTKKETIDERETSSVLNLLFISADDQMKKMEVEECTTNIHDDTSNSFVQPDNETKITDDKELMDTTEFTSQSKFVEQLARRTSVVTRFKSIIFLFLTLLRINIIIIIIKKLIPSKLIMLTDKARKDKKPEDI